MTGYYVGIKEPAKARRDLLQTAKCSVTILKSKHRLKDIRKQKVERLARLVVLADELKEAIAGIDSALPEHQPGQEPKIVQRAKEDALAKLGAAQTASVAKSAKKKAKPVAVKKSAPKPAKKTLGEAEEEELAKLERKLNEIESKLNKL